METADSFWAQRAAENECDYYGHSWFDTAQSEEDYKNGVVWQMCERCNATQLIGDEQDDVH